MRPPRSGLRPIHNRTQDVAKVELRVPAGGTVSVQDDVAAQLLATGAFGEGAAPAGLLDALDAGHELRYPAEARKAPEPDPVPDEPKVKPARKPAK